MIIPFQLGYVRLYLEQSSFGVPTTRNTSMKCSKSRGGPPTYRAGAHNIWAEADRGVCAQPGGEKAKGGIHLLSSTIL